MNGSVSISLPSNSFVSPSCSVLSVGLAIRTAEIGVVAISGPSLSRRSEMGDIDSDPNQNIGLQITHAKGPLPIARLFALCMHWGDDGPGPDVSGSSISAPGAANEPRRENQSHQLQTPQY